MKSNDNLKKLLICIDDEKLKQELWNLAEAEERHERWESEKRRRRETSLDSDDAQSVKVEYSLASKKEAFLNGITKYDLYHMLSKLDINEQRLMHLLYFQSYTEREVAQLYGVSQKAINKRKAKVLKKLQILLSNIKE